MRTGSTPAGRRFRRGPAPLRYLLVGNADGGDVAAAGAEADVIVQINACRHKAVLPPGRTHVIFLTNTGAPLADLTAELLGYHKQHAFPEARLVLARNPAFYTAKKRYLKARRRPGWQEFRTSDAWRALRGFWPIEKASFLGAVRIERQLQAQGMPGHFMPSTGMVAYDWLVHRLRAGDSLAMVGFTFEGWDRHPWAIESRLIRPISATERRGRFA